MHSPTAAQIARRQVAADPFLLLPGDLALAGDRLTER
jgi:hypothetical protein